MIITSESNYANNLKTIYNGSFLSMFEKNGCYYHHETDVTHRGRLFWGNDLLIVLKTFIHKIMRPYFSQNELCNNQVYCPIDSATFSPINGESIASHNDYCVQHIGHATLLIKVSGFNIIIDPVWGNLDRCFYRQYTKSLPAKVENLSPIDIVLITHNHRDHMDKNSIVQIIECFGAKNVAIVTPVGTADTLKQWGCERVIETKWYDKIIFDKTSTDGIVTTNSTNIDVISLPSKHCSGRQFSNRHAFQIDFNESAFQGFLINPHNANVIFKLTGDTAQMSAEMYIDIDTILWHEILLKNEKFVATFANNDEFIKSMGDITVSTIICVEPSGPNYPRNLMKLTHQSTAYSVLSKFRMCINLAKLSGKSAHLFLDKTATILNHHNKFRLGADVFNEGLFIHAKLLKYLTLLDNATVNELMHERNESKYHSDFSTVFIGEELLAVITLLNDYFNEINEPKNYDELCLLITKYIAIGKYILFPKIGETMTSYDFECIL